MSDNKRNIANITVGVLFIIGMMLWSIFKPDTDISQSERRHLAQKPQFSINSVFTDTAKDTFMEAFEKYAADQFALRDEFRTINSAFSTYILGKKEVNDLYVSNGYIVKIQRSINEESVAWSLDRLGYINERYLGSSNAYFAIIPDKGYYVGDASYPGIDYDEFVSSFRKETDQYAEYIDLSRALSSASYYFTDTHWKQEELYSAAQIISNKMGNEYDFKFTENELDGAFKGVYYGQLALPLKTDRIKYLTGDYLDSLIVKCYDSGSEEEMGIYDFDKADGADRYEFFLSGSKSLITIENPQAVSDKELVIFRDSFGSSIAPLLAGNYKKTTLIDIRYINPSFLGRFVEFEGADVLFLYCEEVLNNSVGQFIK
jgi:hypothetical protein